jgi:hypothetical protein
MEWIVNPFHLLILGMMGDVVEYPKIRKPLSVWF